MSHLRQNEKGGHYTSLIKSREDAKWFYFSDSEVRPFEKERLAEQCFGYDGQGIKDQSAYMLLYERKLNSEQRSKFEEALKNWVELDNIQQMKAKLIQDPANFTFYFDLFEGYAFPQNLAEKPAFSLTEKMLKELIDSEKNISSLEKSIFLMRK